MKANIKAAERHAAPIALAEVSKNERRRGINSVEVGLRVLRAIIELAGPSSLKRIAERAGLDPSQAHRYISSLVNFGLVSQEPVSALYALGPSALQVGMAALATSDPLSVATFFARDFSIEHSVTTLLSVWGPYGPTIIRWYHGNPPVYTTLTIGSVLPMTRSATGLAFMAFLPEPLLDSALVREGYAVPIRRNTALMAEREVVRAEFLATVDGLAVPGLRAAACPLLAVDNRVVAVVATAGSDSIPKSGDREIQRRLITGALDVSARLGARNLPDVP